MSVNLSQLPKHSRILAGALAAAVCVSGVTIAKYSQALSQAQAENQAYEVQLTQLQEQADTIQSHLDDLSQTKDELTQKLDEVAPEIQDGAASGAETSQNTGTAATKTSRRESATPLESVASQLSRLEDATSSMMVAYTGVSESVTETLAYLDAIPSGDPLHGQGQFSCAFGYRSDPITGQNSVHTGLDLRCPSGTPIYATATGTVIVSEAHATYGNYIQIDHGNGYVTVYAHCTSLEVAVGDTVERGDLIAYSGATGRVTGKHLHYEVRLNNQFLDPMDFMELD